MGSASTIARVAVGVISAGTSVLVENALAAKDVKEGVVDKPAQARKDAQAAADQQQKTVAGMAADAEARRTNEEGATAAAETAQQARQRQLAIAATAQGRRSTILTGPLGVVNDATVARKSILGA